MRQDRPESLVPYLMWPKPELIRWPDFPGRAEINALIDGGNPRAAMTMASQYRDRERDSVLRRKYHGLFLVAQSRAEG